MEKKVYLDNIFGSQTPCYFNDQCKRYFFSDREIKKLTKITNFEFQEIKALHREFTSRSGQKSCNEAGLNSVQLLAMFGLSSGANYYFSQKFVELFTINKNKSSIVDIGFKDFLIILSKWSRGDPIERISMIFAMYDDGHKGYVSKKDIMKFLYSLAMYFLEIEYAWLDINSESFKSRTIVAHHSVSEIIDCLHSNLEFITSEAIKNFHEPDGEELLWCDGNENTLFLLRNTFLPSCKSNSEFKQWFISLPGITELVCPTI